MKENAVISEMTLEELRDAIAEQKEKVTRLRINHAVSQLENPMQIRMEKKKYARLNTEMRKREIAAQNN